MDQHLVGEVAVVTGAARGIGMEIAAEFARQGALVALVDRSPSVEESAHAIASSGAAAIGIVADVTVEADVTGVVERVVRELGSVTALVNNAYAARGEDVLSTTEADWDYSMAGVAKSAFLCSRAVLPGMIASGRGSIVNVASINAFRFGGHDAYSAGKAAMLSLTRTMAGRHGRDGVRVNAIIPGTVVTPNWDTRVAANPQVLEQLTAYYPMGRLGTPADIAYAAVFLTSTAASWITGAELAVDGGYLVANTDLHTIAEGPQ